MLFYIYVFPLLSPTLPSTSMHASTPLPSPPLGCPTLFYLSFPYSHYPSSPIHYYRIPPLNSAHLRSTLLPAPTQPSPIPYPFLAPLPPAALSYPPASSTIPSPLLILHSPTLTERQPSPTLPSFNSPPLRYLTLSSYPTIHSSPLIPSSDVPYPAISPP